jgi:hypothetical protein
MKNKIITASSFLFILGVFAFIVLLSTNIFGFEELRYKGVINTLEENRGKWQYLQINHYRYVVNYSGYGIGNYEYMPWNIEVENNIIISIIDAKGQIITPDNDTSGIFNYGKRFLITELFAELYRLFIRKPPEVRVIYNVLYGYPENIFANPFREPCCQDYGIVITDFQIIE